MQSPYKTFLKVVHLWMNLLSIIFRTDLLKRDKQPFTLIFTSMSNLELQVNLTCLWSVGGRRSIQGAHANATQKSPGLKSNPQPSCFEGTVATTTPPCRPMSSEKQFQRIDELTLALAVLVLSLVMQQTSLCLGISLTECATLSILPNSGVTHINLSKVKFKSTRVSYAKQMRQDLPIAGNPYSGEGMQVIQFLSSYLTLLTFNTNSNILAFEHHCLLQYTYCVSAYLHIVTHHKNKTKPSDD